MEQNKIRGEVRLLNILLDDKNISLKKSKIVFKTIEEAKRNIQNGLKEVKGLYTTAEVNF